LKTLSEMDELMNDANELDKYAKEQILARRSLSI
jgi:hypothetical protein